MAEKVASSQRKSTKRKVKNGDSLICEVCGLSIIVEEVGGMAVAEETTLLCCGKPMREKTSKAKTAKK